MTTIVRRSTAVLIFLAGGALGALASAPSTHAAAASHPAHAIAGAAIAGSVGPLDAASDSAAALAVFRTNIDAIHKRDRARYLATYAQEPRLTRIGLRDVTTGWDGWDARTSNAWPDTLIANELRVWPLADGVVYGRYRYVGVNKGVASTGISERLFVKTKAGWRIILTGSYPDTLPAPAVKR